MSQKILLIEDEEALLDMYSLKFRQDKFEILAANRGKAGIALAKKAKPDLILLDLVMPEMDGYDVLKILKADKQTSAIPVIILSNLGQQEEIDQGLELGAEQFIVKASLTPSALVEKVRSFFAQKS